MKVTQMSPVHAANLVANSGNTAYGVDVIPFAKLQPIKPRNNDKLMQKNTNIQHNYHVTLKNLLNIMF